MDACDQITDFKVKPHGTSSTKRSLLMSVRKDVLRFKNICWVGNILTLALGYTKDTKVSFPLFFNNILINSDGI